MSSLGDYTVGWICDLWPETLALELCLDEPYRCPTYLLSPNDTNRYILGKIFNHNVVIVCPPDRSYDTFSTSDVANNMLRSFPNITIGLMVGISGGAPSTYHDIRLGDIVVGSPRDCKRGIPLSQRKQDQDFQETEFLSELPSVLLTAVEDLKADYQKKPGSLEATMDFIIQYKEEELQKKLKRPDASTDILYQNNFVCPFNTYSTESLFFETEPHCFETCGIDPVNVVSRPELRRRPRSPVVHYGLIALTDRPMTDAIHRDEFATRWDVLCFAMEPVRPVSSLPCLHIRGICDYADSHKNNQWQGYAAMAAAAYARDLLSRIALEKVVFGKQISDFLSGIQEDMVDLRHREDHREKKAILDWLSTVHYTSLQSEYIRIPQARNGLRLLNLPEYHKWLQNDKRTLFYLGGPGAGKTVLTSVVVENLTTRFRNEKSIGVAYLYCDFQRRNEQQADHLLASLLQQLVQGLPSLPDCLKSLYGYHKDKGTYPSLDEISRTLQFVAAKYLRVFIVVDALDECQESNECRSIFLSQLLNLQANTRSNIFATSRPIPDNIKILEGVAMMKTSGRDEDVKSYIDAYLPELQLLEEMNQGLSKETKENYKYEIRTTITSVADGVFLFAQLPLKFLIDKTTPNDLDQALLQVLRASNFTASATGGSPPKGANRLPTDSDYGSAPSASHIGKETIRKHHPQTVVEKEHETETDQGERPGDIESTGAVTKFSDASSVAPPLITQACSDFSRGLFYAVLNENLDDLAMRRIDEILPELLKSFALRFALEQNEATVLSREVMYYVWKNPKEIARQFRLQYTRRSNVLRLRETANMSLREILTQWHENMSNPVTEVPPELLMQPLSDGSDDTSVGDSTESSFDEHTLKYPNHPRNSLAYKWLLESLQGQILLAPAVPDLKGDIRRHIFRWLPGHKLASQEEPTEAACAAYFEIDWDPRSFALEQQYTKSPDEAICSAITLTGLAQHAQALTSSQYLAQTWPSTGNYIMQMVQEVLRREHGEQYYTEMPDRTRFMAWYYGPRLMVEVFGSEPSIAEVGEQLAWLGAALRSPPQGNGVCYCTPVLTVHAADALVKEPSISIPLFRIHFQFEEVGNELSNGHCWHNMFRRPVLVRGYPISRRTATQTGLEMPLNMMACMIRTSHVVPFDSTWYLKGFSSMLALVERRDNLFLWHHIYDSKGGRVSYFDHVKSSTMAVAAVELENARHVIGWCSDVKLYAGALEDINYKPGASKLPHPHASCVLDKISISGGKMISGGVGISVGVRDSPIRLCRDTYRDKMRWVSGQYAILWDIKDERGWLINGASALLHVVRASLEDDLEWMQKYAQHDDTLFKTERDMMSLATSPSPDSALSVLMNRTNKDLKIFVNDVEIHAKETTKTKYTCFKDLVEKQYSLLEQIMDHQFHIESRSGLDLKQRSREYLEGWDFRDLTVTIKKDPIYARLKKLRPIGRGWVDFARGIKAITLFGRDFGDIIRPTDTASMCSSWTRVPTGKFYLAACVPDLKAILGMADHEHHCATPISICEGLHWHASNNLFRQCQCGKMTGNKVKHSEVAQVLAPRKRLFARAPETSGSVELDNAGAVIFGYNSIFKLNWPKQGDPDESDIPTDTVEETSDFLDSAIGMSPIPTTTGGSSEAQASTDPSLTTAVPPAGTLDAIALGPSVAQEFTSESCVSLQLHHHTPGDTSGQAIDDPLGHLIQLLPHDQTNDRVVSGNVTTEPLGSPATKPLSCGEQSAVEVTGSHEGTTTSNATREKVKERLKSVVTKAKLAWRSRR